MKIKKDITIKEVITNYPATIEVFLKNGMHCITCEVASFETIEQACQAHNLDLDKLLKELDECTK